MEENKKEIKHSERAHALLSPSACDRWMNCTMSVPLSENYPETSSTFAEEGTRAHELCEWHLREKLREGLNSEPVPAKPEADDEEMERYAEDYAIYVLEQRKTGSDIVMIEQRVHLRRDLLDVNLSEFCFGTADCLIVSSDRSTLHVIDYKYGKGVEVSAVENPQLMLYALMTLSEMHSNVWEAVNTIYLHIYQPRIGNISKWEVSKDDIYRWSSQNLTPALVKIISKNYSLHSGDHCRWCRHKVNCKQYAMTYFDPIVEEMRLDWASIPKERIPFILECKADVVKWLNELSDKVTEEILNGARYDGFKVVEGRSVRSISDENGAVNYLRSQGYDASQIFKPLELKNITALTKLMGKKAFEEGMSPFLEKPQGKPTLVPITDKRPDFQSEERDLSLFNN